MSPHPRPHQTFFHHSCKNSLMVEKSALFSFILLQTFSISIFFCICDLQTQCQRFEFRDSRRLWKCPLPIPIPPFPSQRDKFELITDDSGECGTFFASTNYCSEIDFFCPTWKYTGLMTTLLWQWKIRGRSKSWSWLNISVVGRTICFLLLEELQELRPVWLEAHLQLTRPALSSPGSTLK